MIFDDLSVVMIVENFDILLFVDWMGIDVNDWKM